MTDGERLRLSKSLTPRTNRYIPIGWNNTQQIVFLLLSDKFEVMYGGAAGGGKALALDTPIPTPTGWTTMGDLRKGDLVFSNTGEVARVNNAFPVLQSPKSYRITFDDNSTIDACSDHKWLTFSVKELEQLTRLSDEFRQKRKANREKRGTGQRPDLVERNQEPKSVLPPPAGTVRTTEQIAQSVIYRGRNNHAIPIAGALDMPDRDLPLDPYLFGLWLGDGKSTGDGITTADIEVVEAFRSQFTVKKYSGQYEYGINGLVTVLRSMGLIRGRRGKKTIPVEYLRASPKQRLELLRGLMDSDGHACESGSVEFTSVIKGLADQVLELILSLGHKAAMGKGKATLNGRYIGPKYRIKWTAPDFVFHLERKRKRQKLATRRTTKFRYIKSVEEISSVPMRCISVDSPSHLFLAGTQMVPTHNSEALLAGAAQFVDVPNYAALILRRSFRDLALPGALMDRSQKWWRQSDAKWDGTNYKWTFPSGAVIQFGYMEHEGDQLRYQSSEYQYIGFDELTQFSLEQYTYMFSRLRRLKGAGIPIRMRSATNPGGVGHEWVKKRWDISGKINRPTVGEDGNRVFIPAKIADNPYLDADMYEKSFEELSEITRAQLEQGDWELQSFGGKLDPLKFQIIQPNELPDKRHWTGIVRHWDLASSEKTEANTDPDWTAGCKTIRSSQLSEKVHEQLIANIRFNPDLEYPKPPYYYITDVQRKRVAADGVEELIRRTAHMDGRQVPISMEQERGSSGKLLIANYRKHVVPGFQVHRLWVKDSKESRASIVGGRSGEGRYFIVDGHYVAAFLDEIGLFGIKGVHDDQVDAMSGAHIQIERLEHFTTQGRAEQH